MSQLSDPPPGPSPDPSPYERLGLPADAGFDAVQAARDARLADVAADPLARARIEAAYDAILMARLKERQQGKVSTAARTASQREQATPPQPPRPPALPTVSLPRLQPSAFSLPRLALAEGSGPLLALATIGGLTLLALLLPAAPLELLLALAVLACVVSLQRRTGRLLAAVGWGLGLLTAGLVLGGLLAAAAAGPLPLGLPLSGGQLQSLPAFALLLLGALLIA